jgi:hypothetical protein
MEMEIDMDKEKEQEKELLADFEKEVELKQLETVWMSRKKFRNILSNGFYLQKQCKKF